MYDTVITTSFETTGTLEFRAKQCPGDMVHVPTVTMGKSFILSRLDNQLGTLCDSEFSLLKEKKTSLQFNECISSTYYVQDFTFGARKIKRNMTFSALW